MCCRHHRSTTCLPHMRFYRTCKPPHSLSYRVCCRDLRGSMYSESGICEPTPRSTSRRIRVAHHCVYQWRAKVSPKAPAHAPFSFCTSPKPHRPESKRKLEPSAMRRSPVLKKRNIIEFSELILLFNSIARSQEFENTRK